MGRRKSKSFDKNVIRARCLYVRKDIMKATQEEAARELGYKGISQVSKMEALSSNTSINDKYLCRLSDWAGVSLDFLYGKSNYPERDPQTVEQMAVFNASKQFMEKALDEFSKMLNSSVEVNSLEWRVNRIGEAWNEFEQAWARLIALNPEFEENARGGARVLNSMGKVCKEIKDAKHHIEVVKQSNKRCKSLESALKDYEESKQVDYIGFE